MTGAVAAPEPVPEPLLELPPFVVVVLTTPVHPASNATPAAISAKHGVSAFVNPRAKPIFLKRFE
jgi:hypothetical protein